MRCFIVNNIIRTTILGLFFGTFGTTLGGMIGVSFKSTSNKFLSFILSFSSGLMMSIICFDLIPEALETNDVLSVIIGVVIGVISIILCDLFTQKKLKYDNNIKNKKDSLLKTGIAVSIGLALHNFPEGLAIGSGLEASIKLGLSLAIALCLHDIPEGISMAVPMKTGGMKASKVILLVILSGITTGLGAFFGAIIGNISKQIISLCLSFAAGAMLYIVSGELIPESNKLYKGRITAMGNMLGFIIGILATTF